MKLERWHSGLECVLFTFAVSYAGIGCLMTAFEFGPPGTSLTLWCVFWAVVCAVCYTLRLAAVPPCILALLGGYLWETERLMPGLETFLYRITKVYDSGYGWGTVFWDGNIHADKEMLLIIGAVAALTAIPTALAVARRRGGAVAAVAGFLPLCACFVVTDSVPAHGYLFLLLFSLVLLAMTQPVRRRSGREGNRLTWILAAPVALAVLILFAAVPVDGYRPPDLREAAVNAFQKLQGIEPPKIPGGELGVYFDAVTGDRADLASLGPRGKQTYKVMEAFSDQTMHVYLRGRSFDHYDGKSWTCTVAEEDTQLWPGDFINDIPTPGGGALQLQGMLSVKTLAVHPVRYIAYYPPVPGALDWESGKIGNPDGKKEYQIYCYSATLGVPDYKDPNGIPAEYQNALQPYLMLPDETRERTAAILERIFPEGMPERTMDTAAAICAYVKNSAVYDLKTRRMPGEETDFALWFLEKSDTGYCVHFATAAAVLLRAAGVPARYVTGYVVTTRADKTVNVVGDDAHAWVEYYLPGRGWTVLEATNSVSDTIPETEPEETEPETEPETESTEPDTTTAPTEEKPTFPTKPDETRPGETVPGIPDGKEQGAAAVSFRWLLKLCYPFFALAVIAGLAVGQWRFRLERKRRRRRRGTPNARAMVLWQETLALSHRLGEPPEEGLRALAEKAKYSQHTLSPEELARFVRWQEHTVKRLRRKPWYKRLIDRLVFAAY